jgi:hypothetical protein
MKSVAGMNGTAAQEILSMASGIPVRIIGEPLVSLGKHEPYMNAVEKMKRNHFDAVGVADTAGRVIGYVDAKGDSAGTCGDKSHLHTIEPGTLVTDGMPLTEAAPIVARRRRVFILDKDRTAMIVTRADLQKAPVRMMIFGIVTVMEIHLTELLRQTWLGDTWADCGPFTAKQAKAIRDRFHRAEARDEETDVFDGMTLNEKSVLAGSTGIVVEALNMSGPDDLESSLIKVRQLRNAVAHSKSLVTSNRSWNKVVHVTAEAQRISGILEELLADDNHSHTASDSVTPGKEESPS